MPHGVLSHAVQWANGRGPLVKDDLAAQAFKDHGVDWRTGGGVGMPAEVLVKLRICSADGALLADECRVRLVANICGSFVFLGARPNGVHHMMRDFFNRYEGLNGCQGIARAWVSVFNCLRAHLSAFATFAVLAARVACGRGTRHGVAGNCGGKHAKIQQGKLPASGFICCRSIQAIQ